MSMYSPPLYISAKGGGALEAATEAEEWRQFLFLGAVQLFWAWGGPSPLGINTSYRGRIKFSIARGTRAAV